MNKIYVETVQLLLEAAPAVFAELPFAMKGGTALNFFIENMPRLSVDIDVVYTDHTQSREDALFAIAESLKKIQERLIARGIAVELRPTASGEETKLLVRRNQVVKIEVNYVFRGSILPIVQARLVPEARSLFGMDIDLPTQARSELYGSKLVAAMDRQHPRDLFDVRGLYAATGLTRMALS